MHLHLGDAVALAGLATAALHIEAEPAGLVAARPGLLGGGEELAHGRENTGVGGGIGARGAPDRALVYINALVYQLHAFDRCVGRGRQGGGAVQFGGSQRIERAVDQCGLAGAGDAGYAGQQAQGNPEGDRLQVVAARPRQYQLACGVIGRAPGGYFNPAFAGQVGAGQ